METKAVSDWDICPRCHREIASGRYTAHYRKCVKIPLPEMVIIELQTNEDATLSSLAAQYGCSISMLRKNLMHNGYEDKVQAIVRQRRTESLVKARLNNRNNSRRDDLRRCSECDLLLDHPKVPIAKGGKRCRWCVDEEKGIRKVKEAWDYQPEATVWA